ncbi:MAG TPA: GNAT family N-acetyltransferase [Micromonosporaceae bacterium]|nr:GNAT family N-acetyltransferase [Micromonosporaceae bacterium]
MTLWRVRATVDDRPGFLAVLTASLALKSVNILSVQVHGTEAGAVDDFLVDAPNDLTEGELLAAVERGRGRDPWVRRTEAHHLVDPPTEVLSAATRIVRDPDDLADALGGMLLATVVRRVAPADSCRPGFADTRMHIPNPAGGTLLVQRPAPPFTPAEYARGRALVELAAEVRRTAGMRWIVTLANGDEIEIRTATDADIDAIEALYGRCSAASLRDRFMGARPSARRPRSPESTLIGVTAAGLVIGVGTLDFDGPDAEIAVLVDDAVQRRGVGTALIRRLAGLATTAGAVVAHAHVYRDNAAMIRTFDRIGFPVTRLADGPVVTLSADLRVAGDVDNDVGAAGGR